MQKLSPRKALQVNHFFNDENKVARLHQLLSKRKEIDPSVVLGQNLAEQDIVYRVNIAGKRRAVKINPDEYLAHKVSDSIRRAHAVAVKRGLFRPKYYSLQVVNFLGSGKHASVMPIINSFDANRLSLVLREGARFDKNKNIMPFLKKHLWVNSSVFQDAYRELKDNLEKLDMGQVIPTFDMARSTNVFVVGANDKTKKLVFALIDQAHPSDKKRINEFYSQRLEA